METTENIPSTIEQYVEYLANKLNDTISFIESEKISAVKQQEELDKLRRKVNFLRTDVDSLLEQSNTALPKTIIFVGPDRCGKTEIGKELANVLKYQYYKNTSEGSFFSHEDKFDMLLRYHGPAFVSFLENIQISGGLILDRFTPCEYAYAKTYGRSISEDIIWELDKRLAAIGTVIIFCEKDAYTTFEDEYVKEIDVHRIKEWYKKYFEKTSMRVLHLNTTDENLTKQIETILNFLKKDENIIHTATKHLQQA